MPELGHECYSLLVCDVTDSATSQRRLALIAPLKAVARKQLELKLTTIPIFFLSRQRSSTGTGSDAFNRSQVAAAAVAVGGGGSVVRGRH